MGIDLLREHGELLLAFEHAYSIMVLGFDRVADIAKVDLCGRDDGHVEDLGRLCEPTRIVCHCGAVEEMLLQHLLDVTLEENGALGIQPSQATSCTNCLHLSIFSYNN